MKSSIFENLFVLELANNHWGNIHRGMKIIKDFAEIIKKNNIKAAIKFQFRDVDNFIHTDFKRKTGMRYVDKTLNTKISWKDMKKMLDEVRKKGILTMATPFDEYSVNKCKKFNIDLVKIASSDAKDKSFINKVSSLDIPTIVSTGGCSENDIDWIYEHFKYKNVPLAINHCVSLYPSEDHQLELNQIDFLKNKYKDTTIGFSSHEYNTWDYSLMIAYAKGARTFERHIDVNHENIPVSKYCSLPHQIDDWFNAFKKVKELCGESSIKRREICDEEKEYLDKLVRGVYIKKNINKNKQIELNDIYFSIPKLEGQISCQEFKAGLFSSKYLKKNKPLFNEDIYIFKKENNIKSKLREKNKY